jgi:hypothetical chaperone protein
MELMDKAYAIDFGTSNSGIAIIDEQGVRPVEITNRGYKSYSKYVEPSMLFMNRDGNKLTGWDALTSYLPIADSMTNGDSDAILISGLKNLIGDWYLNDGEKQVFRRWGINYRLDELIGLYFRGLRKKAEAVGGDEEDSVKKLVLGHPVVFRAAREDNDMNVELLQRVGLSTLEKAAEFSGFDEVLLCNEATAISFSSASPRGRSIAFDFGAGTLDICAIDASNFESPEVVSVAGIAIGGQDFDRGLFSRRLDEHFGLDISHEVWEKAGTYFPNRYNNIRVLADYLDLLRKDKAKAYTVALELASVLDGANATKLENFASHLISVRGHELYFAIQDAKAELSTQTHSEFEWNFQPGNSASLQSKVVFREEDLAEEFAMFKDGIESVISRILQDANWSASDVNEVVVTGGSSQLAVFSSFLNQRFPEAELVRIDPFGSILGGLGRFGFERWMK